MVDTVDLRSQRAIDQLRKPEARSEYSMFLLSTMQEYYSDVVNQPNPSETVRKFNQHGGVIFPIGSVLRGTARVASDLDVVLLYDDPADNTDITDIRHLIYDEHPSKKQFCAWLGEKAKDDPSLKKFYEQRRGYMRSKVEYHNQKHKTNRPFNEEQDVIKRFVSMETVVGNVTRMVNALEGIKGSTPSTFMDTPVRKTHFYNVIFFEENEEIQEVIPSLLTMPDSYVVGANPQSLLSHQKNVVQALAHLEEANTAVFQAVYKELSSNFYSASVSWTSTNHTHATSLEALFSDYVAQSGRFPPEKVERATQLLDTFRKQTQFPPFSFFKHKFLQPAA